MARVVIPIYFDYASTLCYIASRIVSELEPQLGLAPLWKGVPIELRDARARPRSALGPTELEKIAIVSQETGIRVVPPERWLNSRTALEGAELARDAGCFAAYHEAVFHAAFEERLDIGSRDVLAAIAGRIGLEPEQFRSDLESRKMASRIDAHKAEADRFSALGYPTFMLGDFPLIGIQPIETMRLLFKRFIEVRASSPGA